MVLSLERNPVSSLHSQHACNQFLSRESLLHCIENWSGTESFWPLCLLGYDFGFLFISPSSSGQHNFTLYCNEKTTTGLGVLCLEQRRVQAWRWSPAEDNLKLACFHKSGFRMLGFNLPHPHGSGELSLFKKEEWNVFWWLSEMRNLWNVKQEKDESCLLMWHLKQSYYWTPQMCQHGVRRWWVETLEVLS